jgi:fructose/tagatose bisphosphate aldolase
MPIVTDPAETRATLDLLRARRAALPCFCTENAWTTEAIVEATLAAGRRFGIPEPPVSISFCSGYSAREHLKNYRVCGIHRFGLESVLADLRALMSPEGPYAACRVLPMLDHGQPEADRWLLEGRPGLFALVMFDASHYPLEENMRRTAEYVRRFGDRLVIEGAVDELKEARAGGEAFEMTTPEEAARFLEATDCDLIVPNVGTEHRAAQAGKAEYRRERARQIAEAVGPRLVLHGTSCMGDADLSGVPLDGFVKVNVWTIIETTGARAVADYVVENIGRMVDTGHVEELVRKGLLGKAAMDEGARTGPDLDYFPLMNLQRAWVARVSSVLERYFEMFGYARLA